MRDGSTGKTRLAQTLVGRLYDDGPALVELVGRVETGVRGKRPKQNAARDYWQGWGWTAKSEMTIELMRFWCFGLFRREDGDQRMVDGWMEKK